MRHNRRFNSVIWMSLSVGWLALTACHQTDPYLREVRPAYDAQGQRMEGYYTIPKPYLEHLLNDLKACYREAD